TRFVRSGSRFASDRSRGVGTDPRIVRSGSWFASDGTRIAGTEQGQPRNPWPGTPHEAVHATYGRPGMPHEAIRAPYRSRRRRTGAPARAERPGSGARFSFLRRNGVLAAAMGAVHSWEFRLRAPPTEGMPQKRETGARSRARAPRWLDRVNTAGPVTRRDHRKYNASTMSHDDAEVLASALEAMPLFPLPGVVLFPGALLPLHVFELRYRAMLADCMATNRCMAMALVAGDTDEVDLETEPAIAHIAGGGVVVRHTELADGRSNIVLQGRVRLALEELPFVAP